MHKVLLVEFAVVGRYHRAVQFPYLAGLLDSVGAPWSWLRFAVPPDRTPGQAGIALGHDDLQELGRLAAALSPSRLVFSRIPDDSLLDSVTACTTLDSVHVLGDTTATNKLPARVCILEGTPDAWLSLAGADGNAHDAASSQPVPHFGYRPANEAARTLQPLPFLVFGAECTYDRPLSSHPSYRDIDLTGCVRQGGCTFCNRPQHDRGSPRFTLDGARSQLESLRRTLPAFDGRLSVRLLGEPALGHIEPLATMIRELDFAPSDWLLDARADRLVGCQSALQRACTTIEGSGHRIHVALVGIESFVRADLERMNKGVDPLQNLDAAIALFRLEQAHENSFGFRTFGGLSTIFFTPWTTLEDLAFNLRVVQQCGLSEVAGKVLGDRLRLEPTLPLTALARRDGLLVDRYDDPVLDTASRNFYGTELPWRFRDHRLEPLARVFVRVNAASSGKPVADPLGQQVAALWNDAAKERFSPIDVALRLVDVVESMPLAQDSPQEAIPRPEEIVDAFALARQSELSPIPGADQHPDKSEGASSGNTGPQYAWAAHLVELCRRGLKPVSKIEPLRPEEVDGFLKTVAPPNPRVRTLGGDTGQRAVHVFFGESSDKVEAAMQWTAQGEDDPDDQRRDLAVAEAGKLLGYPRCCAEAFAYKETPRSRLSYGWMHLHRRLDCPGEVDPIMHPWATALFESYVPCSLACSATMELLHRAEDAAGQVHGDAHVEAMRARSRHPWLVVLQGQGSALELIPDSEPGERFRFHAGQRNGASELLDRAASADELAIEHERLLLLRDSRPVLDLSLRAFVWWYRRAFQVELWSRVLSLRAFLGRDHHRAGRSALDVDGGLRVGKQLHALHRLLSVALAELGRSGRLGRIRVQRLQPVSAGMLSLVLAIEDTRLELYVADAQQAPEGAMRAGPFAFMRPTHQALDTAVRQAAVQALVGQLNAWVAARQRALRGRGGGGR